MLNKLIVFIFLNDMENKNHELEDMIVDALNDAEVEYDDEDTCSRYIDEVFGNVHVTASASYTYHVEDDYQTFDGVCYLVQSDNVIDSFSELDELEVWDDETEVLVDVDYTYICEQLEKRY